MKQGRMDQTEDRPRLKLDDNIYNRVRARGMKYNQESLD